MTNTTNTSANTERDAKQKVIQSVADLDMRDYFAANAMQGMLAGAERGLDADIAKYAYKLADAMLRARGEA